MLPVLIKLGPLTIYTYGFMAATGFIIGSYLLAKRAEVEGEDPQKALDLAFYIVLAALIGSRLLYILIEYESYLEQPLNAFKIWEGGLVFYGGFIGAALTGFWYVKRHNLPAWKMADMTAPSIAIGHVFGRLGCFGAGCCYGRITDSGWGVIFSNPDSLAPLNVPIFPTQLFLSANELIIFFILISFRPYKKFNGQLFLLWMMLYAFGRFVIENFRGDPRGFVGALSTSQVIAIAIFSIAAFLYRKRSAAHYGSNSA